MHLSPACPALPACLTFPPGLPVSCLQWCAGRLGSQTPCCPPPLPARTATARRCRLRTPRSVQWAACPALTLSCSPGLPSPICLPCCRMCQPPCPPPPAHLPTCPPAHLPCAQMDFARLLRDASEGLPVGGRKAVWEAGRPTVVHDLTAQKPRGFVTYERRWVDTGRDAPGCTWECLRMPCGLPGWMGSCALLAERALAPASHACLPALLVLPAARCRIAPWRSGSRTGRRCTQW